MLSNKFVLILAILVISCTFKKQQQRKIYFVDDNNSLEVLNGNVKEITEAPADDKYSLNAGQDYKIIDVNEKGDVTRILTGFHGSIFQTYYITNYDEYGTKLETKSYIQSNYGNQSLKSGPIDIAKNLFSVYKYDKECKIVSYVFDLERPHSDSCVYKYNDKDQLIELDYYPSSRLSLEVTKYKYDVKNNLIESEELHENKRIVKTIYEYTAFDLNNNWIDMEIHSCIFLRDSLINTYKIHRKINYY